MCSVVALVFTTVAVAAQRGHGINVLLRRIEGGNVLDCP
jgi:hypothetical protein